MRHDRWLTLPGTRTIHLCKSISLADLILRSIANGSRECAPDDRLRDASRRMAATHRLAAILRDARKKRTPQDEVGECDDTQFQTQLRMRAEHCTKRLLM